MDLSQIAIAQTNPDNQLRFDARAHEKSVLKTEKRRAAFRAFVRRGLAMLAHIGSIAHRPSQVATHGGTR